MFSKLFSKLKRKKKKEPSPFVDEVKTEGSSNQNVKLYRTKILSSIKEKTVNKIHLPSFKYNSKVIKIKSIVAGIVGAIFLLSGLATLPNPLALLPLISAYFLFDYIWVVRKLKFFNIMLGKREET